MLTFFILSKCYYLHFSVYANIPVNTEITLSLPGAIHKSGTKFKKEDSSFISPSASPMTQFQSQVRSGASDGCSDHW